MKRIITIILSIILLFSFVGCENYLNERQLSHRKFKGEYLAQRNYLDVACANWGGMGDKIENGRLWYYGIDKENDCYVYESKEIGVIDQVLFDGIAEIIETIGRKVVYTMDGLILSSGEKITFGKEEIIPSKNNNDTPRSLIYGTFKGVECRLFKSYGRYVDSCKIIGRGLRLIFSIEIVNSAGSKEKVSFFLNFEKEE